MYRNYESKTWPDKAKRSNMINEDMYNTLLNKHNVLGIKLNNFTKSVYSLMKDSKQK